MSWAKQAPFFDSSMPVHASPVNLGISGIIARGLLLKAGKDEWVVYDQDLLRPAYWFQSSEDKDPLSLQTMAQASWYEPTKKAGNSWPEPQGQGISLAPALPGIGTTPDKVLSDPRPTFTDEAGRGDLQQSERRFAGYRIAGDSGILVSETEGVKVQEWYTAQRMGNTGQLSRNLIVAPGAVRYFLVAKGDFQINAGREAKSADMTILSNHPGLKLEAQGGQLLARLEASQSERRVSLIYTNGTALAKPTPTLPAVKGAKWGRLSDTRITSNQSTGSGWALDRIALPGQNPWGRRVRPSDIAFLSKDRAAVITFEGDVWLIQISGDKCAWRRIAAGLCEPMSMVAVDNTLQVFTRNGLVRLRDENEDGEIDYYENFSSSFLQSASTRAYPLDMKVNPAGETFIAIGGIASSPNGGGKGAPSIPHSGAVMKISADGQKLEVIGRRAREPFFDVDPETGHIAMSDQQGTYVPSSGIFPVVKSSDFGYGVKSNEGLTPPVAWIPHEDDTSSASPLWVRKSSFKEWEGGLLNLSYGTGRLFLVRSNDGWPSKEGSVIPLQIETGIPLLHARVQPDDGSLWLAGFRIYDSRVADLEGLGRMRRTDAPLTTPVEAKAVQEGVILTFSSPLDPSSLKPENVQAKEWQYRRSSSYGSPRLKRDGKGGVDPVATGTTLLSKDGRSVFIHIPNLQPTMQLEVSHQFTVKGNKPTPGVVYFTIDQPRSAAWESLGFTVPKLDSSIAIVQEKSAGGPATAETGKELATRYGCIACHSVDGATQGHSGPTWKGLHGSKREFKDGSSIASADDDYLKESIMEPAKHLVKGYELGMGSYTGVLSDKDIDGIILYIKSLK